MKILQLLVLSVVIFSSSTELSTKRAVGYPNRLQKNVKRPIPLASGRRTLVLQIRSDSPVPIVLKRPSRHQFLSHSMRPAKFSLSPNFLLKSTALLGKHARKPTSVMKIKLLKGKPQTEYVYEKPFSPAQEINNHQIKSNINLPSQHIEPIHTIPAPNLGIKDNHVHYEQPILPQQQSIHYQGQYQVTEEQTNDQTILDPLSGQQKYFAPDPDPSFPAPKIPISMDPFSIPSNGQPLPADIQSNLLTSASTASQVPQQLVHFINPFDQQQLADAYRLPMTTQPQLQQFILQQTSSAQRMPLAVYNPTYLVTQSNNLYNQHQQQLFRPNPNYLESLKSNYGTVDLTQEVASEGQILQAAKDTDNQVHSEISTLQEADTQNNPTFSALVRSPSDYNVINNVVDPHPAHHEQGHVSPQTYNAGSSALQGGFVVSNYFGNSQEPTSYQEQVDLSQSQYDNNLKLERANLALQQQHLGQNAHQYSGHQDVQPSASAYEDHQRLLQQHFGSSPLRIFVPDEEYQTENGLPIQKRSDDYSDEEISEEDKSNSSVETSKEVRKRE